MDLKKYTLILLFLFNSMIAKVFVFGDSHSSFCFTQLGMLQIYETFNYEYNYGKLKLYIPFEVHWLGPKTMHGFGTKGTEVLNLKNYRIKNRDVVVFVFGEIDVRAHILKQRDLYNRKIDEILISLVANYLEAIVQNKKQFTNLSCIIMSILPPIDACYNPEIPFYGSLSERAEITTKLNFLLKQKASDNNIVYLDAYKYFVTDDGTLNIDLSDNCVHINPKHNYLIKNELCGLLITYNIFK